MTDKPTDRKTDQQMDRPGHLKVTHPITLLAKRAEIVYGNLNPRDKKKKKLKFSTFLR